MNLRWSSERFAHSAPGKQWLRMSDLVEGFSSYGYFSWTSNEFISFQFISFHGLPTSLLVIWNFLSSSRFLFTWQYKKLHMSDLVYGLWISTNLHELLVEVRSLRSLRSGGTVEKISVDFHGVYIDFHEIFIDFICFCIPFPLTIMDLVLIFNASSFDFHWFQT